MIKATRRGFTLLEIMIAMTILALVLSAIYASWSAVVRGTKIGLEAAARVQRTRMAMRCIVDALLTMQMFGANGPYYSFIADTDGDFSYLSFVSRLPASFPDAGMFGDQVVRRVTFSVEPSPNGQNQLVMYQTPLLEDNRAAEKPFSTVLARDVGQFSLDFWGPNTNKWADKWLSTNQLPKLVRVSLGLNRANSYQADPDNFFTRVVALQAIVVQPAWQQATAIPGQPGVPGQPGQPGQPMPVTTGPPGMRSVGGDGLYDPSYGQPGGGLYNNQPGGPGFGFRRNP